MPKVTLDQTYLHGGRFYGPGEAEVPADFPAPPVPEPESEPIQPVEMTVDEVLAAVEAGTVKAEDALAAERAGKGRKTLVEALEAR